MCTCRALGVCVSQQQSVCKKWLSLIVGDHSLGTHVMHVLVAELSLTPRSLNPSQYYTRAQLCPYCRHPHNISEGFNGEVPQYYIQTFSGEIIP